MNGWAEIAGAIMMAAGIISGALKWVQVGLKSAIETHAAALDNNTTAVNENTAERRKSGSIKAAWLLPLLALLLAGCPSTDPMIVRALERNQEVWDEDRRPDLDPELVKSREAEFAAQQRYARAPK